MKTESEKWKEKFEQLEKERAEKHKAWVALVAHFRPILDRWHEGVHTLRMVARRKPTGRPPCHVCGHPAGSNECKAWKGNA